MPEKTDNQKLVTSLIASWASRDVEKILSHFAADAIYTNIPIDPPNCGIDAIRTAITGFVEMASEIEFIVHHQAENADGTVMNERSDRFLINDQWIELAVMGVFEIQQGKVTHWRDYFDLQQFNPQT